MLQKENNMFTIREFQEIASKAHACEEKLEKYGDYNSILRDRLRKLCSLCILLELSWKTHEGLRKAAGI